MRAGRPRPPIRRETGGKTFMADIAQRKQMPDAQIAVPAGGRPDLPRIRAYYDETRLDYRLLWLNPQNRAMHFGYWGPETRSHSESLIEMNRQLAAAIGISAGQRVLDAGCGVGGSTIWLTRYCAVRAVGITPVAGQVQRARRYARQHGLADRITFVQADYTQTRFAAGSFDTIWAMESVCHAPDKRRFLAEARRLLRPGGRLGMAEYLRTARPHSPTGEALLHDWLEGWAIPDLATRAEYAGWVAEAGFTGLQVADVSPQVRRSLRRLYRISRSLWPLALLLRAGGLRSVRQHGNSRGAWQQYQAFEAGLWSYGLLTAVAV